MLTGGLALPDAPVTAAYAGATWLVARPRRRGWIAAGVVGGLALLSKYTAALLAPALVVLVLLDGELRRELRTPWPWLGGAVAILVFLPNLLWQLRHGLPFVELNRNAVQFKNAALSLLIFRAASSWKPIP